MDNAAGRLNWWTPKRCKELLALRKAEKSFVEMATIMSKRHGEEISRNAIAGKLWRLGAPSMSPYASRRNHMKAMLGRPGKGVAMKPPVPVKTGRLPPQTFKPRVVADVPEPTPHLIDIMSLGMRNCKWIVEGERRDARYCGVKTHILGEPYCAYHTKMAQNPEQRRRNR